MPLYFFTCLAERNSFRSGKVSAASGAGEPQCFKLGSNQNLENEDPIPSPRIGEAGSRTEQMKTKGSRGMPALQSQAFARFA